MEDIREWRVEVFDPKSECWDREVFGDIIVAKNPEVAVDIAKLYIEGCKADIKEVNPEKASPKYLAYEKECRAKYGDCNLRELQFRVCEIFRCSDGSYSEGEYFYL